MLYGQRAIHFVDEVVVYRKVGDIVDEVDFGISAKGFDLSHAGFQRVVDYCGKNDKAVVVIPRTEGISSSELKDLIKCMKS